MIEIAIGHYPYPPETYSNVFAQLTAIVNGDPPELPEERYSEIARDWVNRCLMHSPEKRATYAELLVSTLIFSSKDADRLTHHGISTSSSRRHTHFWYKDREEKSTCPVGFSAHWHASQTDNGRTRYHSDQTNLRTRLRIARATRHYPLPT